MILALIITGLVLVLGAVMAVFWQYTKYYFCALVYFVCIAIFMIMDFFQDLFLCFAGVPTTGASGAESKGELLGKFIENESVQNAFLGLVVLAIVLLIIFTVIQIIRVEYTTEGAQNSKGNVLKNAVKAIALFLTVPAVCAMGILAGNAILQSVNAATSQGGGTTTLSGELFRLGAHDADPSVHKADTNNEYLKFVPGLPLSEYFEGEEGWNEEKEKLLYSEEYDLMQDPTTPIDQTKFLSEHMHRDLKQTSYYYDITKIGWGFIIIYLLGPLFISALYSAMVGMIMRIYMIVVLYVISPPIIAMTVLDDGSAYKNWRQRFIGNVISAYGTVVTFNLYLIIANVATEGELLHFFSGEGKMVEFYNLAVELLFLLVGAMMIKNISKTISGIIGAEDAMEQGEGIGKQITDKAKKAAIATGTVAAGGMALGVSAGAGIASKVAGFAGKRGYKFLDKHGGGIINNLSSARDSESQDMFGKSYNQLNDNEKKQVDQSKNVKGKLKAYNLLDAAKKRSLDSGRTLHIASKRATRMAIGNFTGMIGNSETGKAFNQVTGNAFKATGGKGVDQWDNEIMSKHDTEKDIFTEHSKYVEEKREARYRKRMGVLADNFEEQNKYTQGKQAGGMLIDNIYAEIKNADDIKRACVDGLREGLIQMQNKKGRDASQEITNMLNNAQTYKDKTYNHDDSLLKAAQKAQDISIKVENGVITAEEGEKQLKKLAGEIDFNGKMETKTEVEVEVDKNSGLIDQLKEAVMSGNIKEMDKLGKQLQGNLKDIMPVKDIQQIFVELRKIAAEEKANDKKLSKLMAQMSKLTNK